jgi:hypothetical protein
MRLRDYFHSGSKMYDHLSSEKKQARVTELWVGVGFGLFSAIIVGAALLIRAIYDNPQFFRALQE